MVAPIPITYATECKINYNKKYNLEEICNELKEKYKEILNCYGNGHNNSVTGYNNTMNNQNYCKGFVNLYDVDNNIVVPLKCPITCRIEADKNGFYYINENLNLYIYGKNQKEAEENIFSELKSQYDLYVLEPDENLDENAILLKQRLIKVLGDYHAEES